MSNCVLAWTQRPQIAYAAEPSSKTTALTVHGQTYNIFTHSYLGFGLNTARERVNKLKEHGMDAEPMLDA